MLRIQSLCSSVHVKDCQSFPWNHIEEITNNKKITARIVPLKRLRDFASRDVLASVYNALIIACFQTVKVKVRVCKLWDY